jgi:3-oxoacyl-[acyl-carrier protein] reductase
LLDIVSHSILTFDLAIIVVYNAVWIFANRRWWRGVIINISSTPAISGYIKGAPYTVAKAANLGITKHIAAEFGKYGIRCNAIAPGTIATHRNWDRLTTEQRVDIVSSIPFGRAGKPEEVAGVALILACDYTSFVNGQTIVVDGGETIR